MKIFHRLLILIVFCLGGAASAFAATPTVSLSSANGGFVLTASGFQSIGGAKIILNYDTSTLANPRVSKGPLGSRATVWLANTNIPGTIVLPLAYENGFPDSGVIATISFDLKGNPPGVIPSLTASVSRIDGGGKTFPARVFNPFATAQASDNQANSGETDKTDETDTTDTGDTTTPTGTGDTTTATDTAGATTSRTGAAGSGVTELVAGGAPAAPAEESAAGGTGSRNEVAQEGTTPASETPAGETANEDTASDSSATVTALVSESLPEPQESRSALDKAPSQVAYKSVLEEFRSFNGQRMPKSLSEIFTGHAVPGVRQEPAVAISDGTSKMRLRVTLRSAGSKAPNFSLTDAKLVSLKPEADGSWLLEVVPAKGSYGATLTILQEGAQTVIPLVVAPPISTSGGVDAKLTEAGFARFLAERGTEKAPRFDLNGDGRRDYLDDYIFTANYLLRKGDPAGERPGRNVGQGRMKALRDKAGSLPGKGAESAK